MSKLEIRTGRFSNNLIMANRTIVDDNIRVETPTAAVQGSKLHKSGEADPSVCGVQELYGTFGDDDLTKAIRGSETQFVDDLQKQTHHAPDVLTIAFLKYTETGALTNTDAAFLVDVLATTSDIITIPLMPKVARLVGSDSETDLESAFKTYCRSVERMLNAAREHAPEMSIMGTLPMVGWKYIGDLLALYQQYDVQMFCLNFDRGRITAGTKVSMMRPLYRHITQLGIEDSTLLYGMNMVPANRDEALGIRPGDDFSAIAMGLDIVGGVHEGLSLSEDAREAMEERNDTETFKLFDRVQIGYRDIPLDQLAAAIPDDLQLDPEFVQQRIDATSTKTKRRYEKVINAEQMAMAAAELRTDLTNEAAASEFADRVGVTDSTIQAVRAVRSGFDEGRDQSSLDDF